MTMVHKPRGWRNPATVAGSLLVVLAVENLLANKFYRREPAQEVEAAPKRPEEGAQ